MGIEHVFILIDRHAKNFQKTGRIPPLNIYLCQSVNCLELSLRDVDNWLFLWVITHSCSGKTNRHFHFELNLSGLFLLDEGVSDQDAVHQGE